MSKTTRSLHAVLALCAGLLWVSAAHAADDKPKVASTAGKTAAKSASSPAAGTQQSKAGAGEKSGTAAPSSADTDKGGNIAGAKKPSPPKVPQDAAAKKAAVQQ